VEKLSAEQALAKYRPSLVLCAWMSVGSDWSRTFRDAAVSEYVLVGDLGHKPHCYSLSYEHPPYERTIIGEVSHHILAIEDAMTVPLDPGYGRTCVVAYTRGAG
jgi:hypothetical protein